MTNLNPKRYLERLESGLVPIAAAQPLVCSTCRSGANPGYERCYRCEDEGIVEVLPISMSIDGKALHHRLRNYKDGNTEQKKVFTLQLAALLHLFLKNHRKCIGGRYDAVVTVPSRRRDAVMGIVNRLPKLRDRHVALTRTGTGAPPTYKAPAKLKAKRVLLLDDTFTRGKSITAAHAALTKVESDVLLPVVIGRHFHPEFQTSPQLAACLKRHTWQLDRCGVCGPVNCDHGPEPPLF